VEWNHLIDEDWREMLSYEVYYPIFINEKMRKCQKEKEKELSIRRSGIVDEKMRNNCK